VSTAPHEIDAVLRGHCEGVVALSARLEGWQRELCRQPTQLNLLLDIHGSPVNLIDPSSMARNVAELTAAAAGFDIDFRIYFARKANKALALVDEAHRLGLGIDLASERELAQVLNRGVPGSALVMTAAVKPPHLLALCMASGTTVVIDNADELRRLENLAEAAGTPVSIAVRLAPELGGDRLPTRFGFAMSEILATFAGLSPRLRIDGVHFHLDGYDPGDRVTALGAAMVLVDALRERGHAPGFVDIGGGIPMSYLDSGTQWEHFWSEHRRALRGEREPLTFEGHGLGLAGHRGEIVGRPNVYPYHQTPIRSAWLADILAAPGARSVSVAEGLRERGLQLRCEPGRALLDGCGLTAARVAYRKQRNDGTWLIGVEMNRTQCRSTSDDFLVDPLLVCLDGARNRNDGGVATPPIEGYLVGAYCIERELLTWRRLRFPHGVAVGDIVIFPNTAGYLMHILESSSHQIPLARNLVVGSGHHPYLDPIDQPPWSAAFVG
jgi:diaminopimelate decarboxylase